MEERNAIALLEEDHHTIRNLLEQLEDTAGGGNGDTAQLCEQLGNLLDMHTVVEEELFYPAHRDARGDREADVLFFEAVAEHRMVQFLLTELKDTSIGTPRFEAGVRIVRGLLERHIEEEEGTIFPSACEHLSADELDQLGQKITERREALAAARKAEGAKGNGRRSRTKARASGEARA